MKLRGIGILCLITIGALSVHGYHPGAEDAEIYVPSVVQMLHPEYFPVGREFFKVQTQYTLFPNLIYWQTRITHIPLSWSLFLWQIAAIFLLLLACWKLAGKFFPTRIGRYGAVGMVAALLTLPIAGTALYILDQYVNPRSISAFAVLFAIDAILEEKYVLTAVWLGVTTLIHPLMAVFGASFVLVYLLLKVISRRRAASLGAVQIPWILKGSASAAYLRCMAGRPGLFLSRWQWYEWLGAVGPLAILWWMGGIAEKLKRPVLRDVAKTSAIYGIAFLVIGAVISVPRQLVLLNRYQPMRSLFLVYVFLVLMAGGFAAEFWFKKRLLAWLLVFVPLCGGMWYAQRQLFPADPQVEWPGRQASNPWQQSFLWIRKNTTPDAVFALDPDYMGLPGEDAQGFRAWAWRSRLADEKKDWSAAVLFPGSSLADECLDQVDARKGWKHFSAADFAQLKRKYGVSWIVLQRPAVSGLSCPYANAGVEVCRLQ